MRDKRNIYKIVIFFLVGVACVYALYTQQAKPFRSFTYHIENQETEQESVKRWLEGYLQQHTKTLNFNNPLQTYEIIAIEPIFEDTEQDDLYTYHVNMIIDAIKEPHTLFNSKPNYESGRAYFDLTVSFENHNQTLRYIQDQSYISYIEEEKNKLRPTEDVNPLDDRYRISNMYLEVRKNPNSAWVKTPVLSNSFQQDSRGWYRKDQRIYIDADLISVVHHSEEGLAVTSSKDQGVTWKNHTIFKEEPLTNIQFGALHFKGQHGFLVMSSYIAINAEIMTIHETLDGGETWISGPTPARSDKLYDTSYVIDNTLFLTMMNDSTLYRMHDRGEPIEAITLPSQILNKPDDRPYLKNLSWEDVFVQAESPFLERGQLVLYMTQGEHGDYEGDTRAKYMSYDEGDTWKFVEFVPKSPKPKYK